MYRIVKTGYIDMAHRIRGHKGKCRFLHGHTWKVEISLSCRDGDLDDLGMVIDFGELKEKFFKWLDEQFDHSCLLSDEDREGGIALEGVLAAELNVHFQEGTITSEQLAEFFFTKARGLFEDERVTVDYVRVYEQLHPTESYAEYRPDNDPVG